jgi:hypothetical protein
MPIYKVPVYFEMSGYHTVEANSKEEAAEKVMGPDYGLPLESNYVEDSFEVDETFFEEDNEVSDVQTEETQE